MTKIKCKNCKPKDEGCHICGGYKILLVRTLACIKCNKKAWFRPDVYTMYVGKMFHSFDGVDLVYTKKGTMCAKCYNG